MAVVIATVPAPIQKAVDRLVGHHVSNLHASCRQPVCVAWAHRSDGDLIVHLRRTGRTYRVTAAIA